MHETERPTLSICLRCRDRRESQHDDVRGGARLAHAVLAQSKNLSVDLRGVNCMSQCKRPCTIALSGPGRFTYVFGDLDPEAPDHLDTLVSVAELYAATPSGLMQREDRPAPLKAGILARVPPLGLASNLVVPLTAVAAE